MDEKDKFKRDTSSLQRSYNQMGRKFKRDSHTSIEPNEIIASSSAGDEKTGDEPLDTGAFIALYLITYLISMAILGIFNYFKPIDYWLFVPYGVVLIASLTVGPETQNK